MFSIHKTKKSTNCKWILQNYSDEGLPLLKMKRHAIGINRKCSLSIEICIKSYQKNEDQKVFLFYQDVFCMAYFSTESFHMNPFQWYPIRKPSKTGANCYFFLLLFRTKDRFGRYCGHEWWKRVMFAAGISISLYTRSQYLSLEIHYHYLKIDNFTSPTVIIFCLQAMSSTMPQHRFLVLSQ